MTVRFLKCLKFDQPAIILGQKRNTKKLTASKMSMETLLVVEKRFTYSESISVGNGWIN